jgi:HPt (histidine-containing phosphotransfer) domain-containing protein
VVRSARALKSLAELLGVNRLADMCAQLEQAVVAQHWSAAAPMLEEIEHGNHAVLTVLFESAR